MRIYHNNGMMVTPSIDVGENTNNRLIFSPDYEYDSVMSVHRVRNLVNHQSIIIYKIVAGSIRSSIRTFLATIGGFGVNPAFETNVSQTLNSYIIYDQFKLISKML